MSLNKKINLEKGENILAIVRENLWNYFGTGFLGLLFILTPSYFAFWLFGRGKFGIASFCLSIFIGLLFFLRIFLIRAKNFSVLTDRRVVNFKGAGFFDEEILSINLYEIQNIFYFKKGVLAKVFNFGDVSLENNQRQELLRLLNVSSPEKVFHTINRLKNDFWLKEKDLDTEEIIDMFVNNLSLFETKELMEIKECVEDVLRNRINKK
ncbi:MAG TPA: PH domain-containing protein [Candidatus Magasanikbacteria bacterium]|nr:PH domain-containing protein [Candidatus Magasanikbacteria bacterium]